jgi:ribonucleotide monophosphatase NagD (HAD superfamily)
MVKLIPLSDLATQYDGLLCDIWGVLHNGVAAFQCAVDALSKYRAQGGTVILLTNAPRSNQLIYPQLAGLGVPRNAFDAVVTSGDVANTMLQEQPEIPLFHFGPQRDQSVLDSLKNPIFTSQKAKLCLLTGPLDDGIESAQVYLFHHW